MNQMHMVVAGTPTRRISVPSVYTLIPNVSACAPMVQTHQVSVFEGANSK